MYAQRRPFQRSLTWVCLAATALLTSSFTTAALAAAPGFRQPDPKVHPDLFVWTDTCNVYVLRDGDAALLIDLGDGEILERLDRIGVKRVEWVLFTHHHREQLPGLQLVPFDITLDDRHYGQLFDFVIRSSAVNESKP